MFESVCLHYTGSNGKIKTNESFLDKKLKEKPCSSIFCTYFNIQTNILHPSPPLESDGDHAV
jgi:hypothetical protein